MRTILALLFCAGYCFAGDADARARACYAASMAEEFVSEPATSNVIQFDLKALKDEPAGGSWQTVRVCDGFGPCHEETRWIPDAVAVELAKPGAIRRMENGDDALDEVNKQRAERGLRPYARDPNLTVAAKKCADVRAAALCFGHTSNDFAALPAGTTAAASGCAAWYVEEGFGACSLYENWTYAGAAWTLGRDGKRYCHLFVR